MSGAARSPWAWIAIALAVAGLAVAIVRPLAGDPAAVATDLNTFAPGLLADIAAYRGPRLWLRAAVTVVGVAVPVGLAFTGWGRAVVTALARSRRGWLAAATIAAGSVVLVQAVQVPLGYVSYRHARSYGFATGSVGAWLRDTVVSAGVVVAVAVVGAVLLCGLLARWPDDWHWRLVPAATLLSGLLVTAYPVVVDPLFNDTTALAAGPVRDAVEEVLVRAGEPDLQILVADASRRTTQANAFVTGLGPSRRVVLYDTLLDFEPELVAVVVAHELGHRRNGDIWRGVALAAAGILATALVLRWVLGSAGWRRRVSATSPNDPRVIALAVVVVAVAELVLTPVGLVASRRGEAAADAVALELSLAPATLIRLQRQFVVRDLSDPTPPRWANLLWGTHPTIDARIRAAAAEAARLGIELPRLADVEVEEEPARWRPQ